MKKRIGFDASAILALLISYENTKNTMISLEKVRNFDIVLNKLLDLFGKHLKIHVCEPVFFCRTDEMNNTYLVLKENFDYKKTIKDYVDDSEDIYDILKNDELLKTINLIIVDGKIVSRSTYYMDLALKYHLRDYITKPKTFNIFDDWENLVEDGFKFTYCLSDEEKMIFEELKRNRDSQVRVLKK